MKKDQKRQRMKCFRAEKGTKKELEQQRNSYVSNPETKQRKKEWYIKDKENQKIFEKEREKKRNKEDARKRIIHLEETTRKKNELKYQWFKWVIDFLHHFFETFKDVCNNTKKKLMSLISNIEENYKKNESQIDMMVKNAKDQVEKYEGEPYPNHFKSETFFQKDGIYFEEILEKESSEMKKTIEEQLELISKEIDNQYKKKEWYLTFKKIKDVYSKTIIPYWFEGKYFLSGKGCFICMDKKHLIDFDPYNIYRLSNQ